MRILNFEDLKKEMESRAAFNVAFLRAIDPRLITHRPRDPEKSNLMAELGIEQVVPETVKEQCEVHVEVEVKTGDKKSKRKGVVPDFANWQDLHKKDT